MVGDATAVVGRVAVEGAVGDHNRPVAILTVVADAAAAVQEGRVAAEGAVGDRKRRGGALRPSVVFDAAGVRVGRVVA